MFSFPFLLLSVCDIIFQVTAWGGRLYVCYGVGESVCLVGKMWQETEVSKNLGTQMQ